MATTFDGNEDQAKGEKINTFWIFVFGIIALVWVSYAMRPGRISVSKEAPEVTQPYVPPPIK
jgi:hypothetical protein